MGLTTIQAHIATALLRTICCIALLMAPPVTMAASGEAWVKSGWKQLRAGETAAALQSWQDGVNQQPDRRLFAVLGSYVPLDSALRQARRVGEAGQAFIVRHQHRGRTLYFVLSALPTSADIHQRQRELAPLIQRAGLHGLLFANEAGRFKTAASDTPVADTMAADQGNNAMPPDVVVPEADPVYVPPVEPSPVADAPPATTWREADYADGDYAWLVDDHYFHYSPEAMHRATREVQMQDIDVQMDKRDARILFLKDPNDKSSFPAQFSIDGEPQLTGRIKSYGSSTRSLHKKALILKVLNGKWHGYHKISLRSMGSDGAMMREWITWELMRDMGMTVPDTHYVRLSINGEFIGVYFYIEWLGKHFLERRGYGKQAEFYQPNDAMYCGDFKHASDVDECWFKFTQDQEDKSSLKTLIKAVSDTPVEQFDQFLAKYFDDDSLINWLVANTLVSQGDTYNKNYFLVKSGTTGKWRIIPWDYDLTFGQTYDPFVKYPATIFNDRFQYYYTPDLGVFNPLKAKVFLNKRLKAKFDAKIAHLIGKQRHDDAWRQPRARTFGWFSPAVMQARVRHLAHRLTPFQQSQKYGSRSEQSFIAQYQALAYYGIARPYFLDTKFFGRLPWSYRDMPQMQEYLDYVQGKDQFTGHGSKITIEPVIDPRVQRMQDALKGKQQPLTAPEAEAKLLSEAFSGHVAAASPTRSMVIRDPGWGYLIALLNFKSEYTLADFQAEAEPFMAPMFLMEDVDPRQCIQRSWILFSRIPSANIVTDVTFDYFDENGMANELGLIKDEHQINLWAYSDNAWTPLVTEVNTRANTLTARNLNLTAGHIYRFVACSTAETQGWRAPLRR